MNKRFYFDYAAATPLDDDVSAAMLAAMQLVGNPSSLHAEGRGVKELLESARSDIARVLNARAETIVFTSTATEADNLAIFGAVTAAGQPEGEIITLATEHVSAQKCIAVIAGSGYLVHYVPMGKNGRIDSGQFAKLLNNKTVLVSVSLATSEIGTLQPIAELGKLIEAERLNRQKSGSSIPISLHCDASSAAGFVSLAVDKLHIDLLTVSSPKIYGPLGAAALYVRPGTPLTPHTIGGGQERSLRAGTENVPAIVGFAAALQKANRLRQAETSRIKSLRDTLWANIKDIPGIELNTDLKHSLPNTLNFSLAGKDGESLVLRLDALGFAVATGAACAESSHEPSHVLQAIGRTKDQAQASLRITMGRKTTPEAVEALSVAIRQLCT